MLESKTKNRGSVMLASGIFAAILSTDAAALCTFGVSASEPSLQQVMNDRLTVAPNAATACLADGADARWTANGGAAATILVEIAGFANQNSFGIYDIANPSQRIEIFSGTAGTNASRTINVSFTGSGYNYSVSNGGSTWGAIFSSASFGYYLWTPQNNLFFSDSTLNTNGEDHLYAYQGNGSTFFNGFPVAPSLRGVPFDSTKYLLAWEDLLHSAPTADRDYQDMVIVTQSITPVPLPAAAILFAPGLAMLGFVRRRKSPAFPV